MATISWTLAPLGCVTAVRSSVYLAGAVIGTYLLLTFTVGLASSWSSAKLGDVLAGAHHRMLLSPVPEFPRVTISPAVRSSVYPSGTAIGTYLLVTFTVGLPSSWSSADPGDVLDGAYHRMRLFPVPANLRVNGKIKIQCLSFPIT